MTIQNKSKPDIKAVVREATDAILNLHAHLAYLRAFDDELRSVMRGKPTMIVNGIFWSAMLHSRDAYTSACEHKAGVVDTDSRIDTYGCLQRRVWAEKKAQFTQRRSLRSFGRPQGDEDSDRLEQCARELTRMQSSPEATRDCSRGGPEFSGEKIDTSHP